MATVEKQDLPVTAAPLAISIAGRLDDRGYHMCRVLARTLQEENTHVSVSMMPMVETDWDDFIRVTATVRSVVWCRACAWGGGACARAARAVTVSTAVGVGRCCLRPQAVPRRRRQRNAVRW